MQYDQPISGSELTSNLSANDRINDATLAAITSILNLSDESQTPVGTWTGAAGDAVTTPEGFDAELVVVTPDAGTDPIVFTQLPESMLNARVTIWDTDRDLDLTYNTIERVIVLGNGSDKLTVNGDENTTVVSGGGNDTIQTTGGDDHITLTDGNNLVDAGAGDDTVQAGPGDDTIDGGEGYDVVAIDGNLDNIDVTIEDGQIILVSADNAANRVTATNVEFFQLNDGESIAIAMTTEEAETLRLYQATLGRSADLEGAKYWLDDLNDRGYSSTEIANAFLFTDEGSAINELDNDAFVAALYENALGREGVDAEIAYWTNDLDNGVSRADVIIAIANSDEGQDAIINVKFIDGLV